MLLVSPGDQEMGIIIGNSKFGLDQGIITDALDYLLWLDILSE